MFLDSFRSLRAILPVVLSCDPDRLNSTKDSSDFALLELPLPSNCNYFKHVVVIAILIKKNVTFCVESFLFGVLVEALSR